MKIDYATMDSLCLSLRQLLADVEKAMICNSVGFIEPELVALSNYTAEIPCDARTAEVVMTEVNDQWINDHPGACVLYFNDRLHCRVDRLTRRRNAGN